MVTVVEGGTDVPVVVSTGGGAVVGMTSGTVVILGSVGRNFAAGMTGGTAYVHDAAGTLPDHCNMELVEIGDVDDADELERVRDMAAEHVRLTGSPRAARLLDAWDIESSALRRVHPRSSDTAPPTPVAGAAVASHSG